MNRTKWADVDEDSEEEDFTGIGAGKSTRFETPADSQGIKTVIEYTERLGKTYKVSRKVKQITTVTWTNRGMKERKSLPKFGKALTVDEKHEKSMNVVSTEEVPIELSQRPGAAVPVSAKDDAEEKFYADSLKTMEALTKEKKVWTDMNRERQMERDNVGVIREALDEKPAAGAAAASQLAGAAAAAGGNAAGQPGRYVPPSLRGATGDGKGKKGDGKGFDYAQQQECSLRVTNLSEDAREGDLQDLFGQCGRLQRVFLAKDMSTGMSKGFAFITYHAREDALRAIKKLHGHGYDNLIMQVQWAKPRT